MIACSFDIRAAKVMTLVLAVIFLLSLWWSVALDLPGVRWELN